MSIIAWIIMGAIIGWLASLLIHSRQNGLVMNIVVGILGALLGGFIARIFGGAGVTGFNLYSVAIGVVGAAILIVIARAISRVAHIHAL
jgi:uncharacterized membrane protein YeaQ/YmgE (transglycosylase-associated protein family)